MVRTSTFFVFKPFDITILSLGEFEDVYYATCAKLKELKNGVDVFLTNGFKAPQDTHLTYHGTQLDMLGPISAGDFKASLLVFENILYSRELTELLNKGIMKKCMRDNKYEGHKQNNQDQDIADNGVDQVQIVQHGVWKHTEEHIRYRHNVFQKNLSWLTGVGGLQNMRNMSCSMIFANLAEKYRPTVMSMGSEGASIDREPTPDTPHISHEAKSNSQYVSPYNLDERAKKLYAPGGPEMPCICDPECMCAPLCASDPTQNCLCEENGLFARVTQGMDIDDLDVPDLVRRKRHGSEISGSSTASILTNAEQLPVWPIGTTDYPTVDDPFDDLEGAIHEVERQRQYQQSRASINADLADTNAMNGILGSSDVGEYQFWEAQTAKPLRVSSLSYRDALTQPFSKQCEYPPKRSSVAQRLFSSRSKASTPAKRPLTLDQATLSQSTYGATTKVLKQASKRSIADMSFAGLKAVLHRDSQGHGTAMHA